MITEQTYETLLGISAELTPFAVAQLRLPKGNELEQLQYFCTRLQPPMPNFTFSEASTLLDSVAKHYKRHVKVVAKVSARSEKAEHALSMSIDYKDTSKSVSPWL